MPVRTGHLLQGLGNFAVGEDVQERRLAQGKGERRFQCVVEYGIARTVGKIRENDGVFFGRGGWCSGGSGNRTLRRWPGLRGLLREEESSRVLRAAREPGLLLMEMARQKRDLNRKVPGPELTRKKVERPATRIRFPSLAAAERPAQESRFRRFSSEPRPPPQQFSWFHGTFTLVSGWWMSGSSAATRARRAAS